MTVKSNDPGIWHTVSDAVQSGDKHQTKKSAERSVAESFVAQRYGNDGVRSLDSVPRSDQGQEVPPDVLIVEMSGQKLGVELVRATRIDPKGAWHTPENIADREAWVRRISKLVDRKEKAISRWEVDCDRKALLVYSDAEGLSGFAFDLVGRLRFETSVFDEVWLLLAHVVDPETQELIQPALFNLSTGEFVE